jgi:hypothetical protein
MSQFWRPSPIRLFLAVVPDSCYRESILFFQMDPRYLFAGMTDGVVIPPGFWRESVLRIVQMDTCHRHAGMKRSKWIQLATSGDMTGGDGAPHRPALKFHGRRSHQ